MLFHISEKSDIARFEPRASELVHSDPASLVEALNTVVLPEVPRWIGLAQS